jgi:hypothetical protein
MPGVGTLGGAAPGENVTLGSDGSEGDAVRGGLAGGRARLGVTGWDEEEASAKIVVGCWNVACWLSERLMGKLGSAEEGC